MVELGTLRRVVLMIGAIVPVLAVRRLKSADPQLYALLLITSVAAIPAGCTSRLFTAQFRPQPSQNQTPTPCHSPHPSRRTNAMFHRERKINCTIPATHKASITVRYNVTLGAPVPSSNHNPACPPNEFPQSKTCPAPTYKNHSQPIPSPKHSLCLVTSAPFSSSLPLYLPPSLPICV